MFLPIPIKTSHKPTQIIIARIITKTVRGLINNKNEIVNTTTTRNAKFVFDVSPPSVEMIRGQRWKEFMLEFYVKKLQVLNFSLERSILK